MNPMKTTPFNGIDLTITTTDKSDTPAQLTMSGLVNGNLTTMTVLLTRDEAAAIIAALTPATGTAAGDRPRPEPVVPETGTGDLALMLKEVELLQHDILAAQERIAARLRTPGS